VTTPLPSNTAPPKDAKAPSTGSKRGVRTCAGCGVESTAAETIRFILGPEGAVVPDLAASEFGRGAHVHPVAACLSKACGRGFGKSFHAKIGVPEAQLGQDLAQAVHRRLTGLFLSARRTQMLVFGIEPIVESLKGSAILLVCAVDARLDRLGTELTHAVAEGRAVAYGTAQHHGEIFGHDTVEFFAILSENIAREVSGLVALLAEAQKLSAGTSIGSSRGEACRSPEGR
jgi:predicted RNA-binding protein YlxR (DUF448 family)